MADQALNSEVDDVLDELLERLVLEIEDEDEDIFPFERLLHLKVVRVQSRFPVEEVRMQTAFRFLKVFHIFRCPKCKANFTILNTYRCLDGSMCDHLCEESICLLLRARWFLPSFFQGKSPLVDEADEESFQEYQEHFEDDYYDDEDYAAEDDKKDKKAAKEAEKRAKRCAKMQAGGSIRSGTSPGGSSSGA
eukprot:gene19587-23427_t